MLLIDDSPIFLEALEPEFRELGWDVHTELSGAGGIASLRTVRPEIVITDLHMPDLSGIHVIKAVHRADPHLPVIVVSGDEEVGSILAVIREGAFDYVIKPSDDIRPLLASIERARSQYRIVAENRRLTAELQDMQDKLAQSMHTELDAAKGLRREIRMALNTVVNGISELANAGLSDQLNDTVTEMGRALGDMLEMVETDHTDAVAIESGGTFHVYDMVAEVRDQIIESLHAADLEFAYLLPGSLPALLGPVEEIREALRRSITTVVADAEPGDLELRATIVDRSDELATIRFEVRGPQRKRTRGDMKLDKAAFELAMSERLIDSLGGEHGEDREDGKPQRVWFTLRLPFLTETDPADPPLEGMSALVIDPSGAGRRCLAMEFDVLGARCVAVSSCAAGLQTLQRQTNTASFDIVLISLAESAWQRSRLLELVERMEPRPMVVTTGRVDDDDPTNPSHHLIKPPRRRDLVALIKSCRSSI